MPRLTESVHMARRLEKFTNYKSKPIFKEIRPPVLGNQVSNRSEGRKGKACLQEMSVMLVCLRDNDFLQTKCTKEIQGFNKCQQEFEMARKQKMETEAKGLMTSTRGRMPSRQVNNLMLKYPQPK